MAISLLQRRGKTVNKVLLIPVNQISANRHQPRKYFDEDAIHELSVSIQQNGLLQPITIRKDPSGGYELIAGERRLLAFRRLGLEKIPAIVHEYTDEESAVLSLIENLQRRDLNFFEEAAAVAKLMQEMGLTQQQISQKLGKAQSTVANKLRLLKYPLGIRDKMLEAGLTERHARALLTLPDIEDEEPVDYVIRNNLNVDQTEKYVQTLLNEQTKPRTSRIIIIKDMRIFLNSINKAVKTMQAAGVDVTVEKQEDEGFIELTMRIPKASVLRKVSP
ncbi:MAG: ParB/RepB/Spo0J family partition protein [Oscillospiraceae bacterium]|nr:ParB/RepB/Spo0J family partition protein [Oscillospiraceae bacterium]